MPRNMLSSLPDSLRSSGESSAASSAAMGSNPFCSSFLPWAGQAEQRQAAV